MSVAQKPTPPWLWPNLLSLDAPVVAMLWQAFLAYRFSVPLRPQSQIVLGLTVWAIYLLDRLLDARKSAPGDEAARHRFYRRHWTPMAALVALVLAADALIALLGLRPVIRRDGFVTLAGVAIYLAAFHAFGRSLRIPKEIAASALFTAGTFLTAWAAFPCSSMAWAAFAFFVLCLANMIAIDAWEAGEQTASHPVTRWLASKYLWWVTAAVVLCAIAGHNPWYASIALSSGACAALFRFGRRIPIEARRALVDGVLLSPVLFLLLK
jgi:hypothetical protein